ncbi:MAG: pyrimidine 5'-nucleotidase, partial [Alphaproteobacteria bacterium]
MPDGSHLRLPARTGAWVFDLDDTLYPASSGLFGQTRQRIRDYIAREMRLDPTAAEACRRDLLARYPTTLLGLMAERAIDPVAYLTYVHDLDYSVLAADVALDALLARLPGDKLVFTNGSVAHAQAVLERLDIARHFSAVFDIAAADFVPKPAPASYARLAARHGLLPADAVMIDDLRRNLPPAAELGMTTVWLDNGPAAGGPHPAPNNPT